MARVAPPVDEELRHEFGVAVGVRRAAEQRAGLAGLPGPLGADTNEPC